MRMHSHWLLAFLAFTAVTGSAFGQDGLRVGSAHAAPGEKASGHIFVPMETGTTVSIPVSVVNGSAAGPVLALVAGTHGMEYTPVFALQRLLNMLDPPHLRGAVILVHLANPPAFFQRRLAAGDPDDLNEQYPGRPDGTASERIAHAIMREVIEQATHLIDLHAGDGNEQLKAYAYFPTAGDSALDDATRAMILAYGLSRVVVTEEMYVDSTRTKTYLDGAALLRGKPAFTSEAGGLAVVDSGAVETHVRGSLRVMAHLGIIEEASAHADEPVWFEHSMQLQSRHTGIWQPIASAGDILEAGEIIGRVTDLFGKVLEEMQAPFRSELLSILGTPPVTAGESVAFLGKLPGPHNAPPE